MIAAVVVGGVLAFLLRTWLVKLSQSQLECRYGPLMHSLADADALTAHCRGLVDAAFKEERKKIAVRRDEELKRVEEEVSQGVCHGRGRSATRNCARSTRSTPIGWSRCRRPSSATCARPSIGTTAVWRSCESRSRRALPRLDENYKIAQGTVDHEARDRPGARWPIAGAKG